MPITLDQMERVRLMNRVDTKFIGSASNLNNLMLELLRYYFVLKIEDESVLPYNTIYYDTPDFQLYTMHHNGKLNRVKIRYRKYEISQIGFLEIKKKNNKRRTDKKRIQTSLQIDGFYKAEQVFINDSTHLQAKDLEVKLINNFRRITLVGKERNERITIDLNLQFGLPDNSVKNLTNLIIIEVKQDKQSGRSPINEILKNNHFTNHSFSKYCIGSLLLYPHLKYNRFKKHMRILENICGNQLFKEEKYEQYIRNNEYNLAV